MSFTFHPQFQLDCRVADSGDSGILLRISSGLIVPTAPCGIQNSNTGFISSENVINKLVASVADLVDDSNIENTRRGNEDLQNQANNSRSEHSAERPAIEKLPERMESLDKRAIEVSHHIFSILNIQ